MDYLIYREEEIPAARNDAERFLFQRAGFELCHCGGIYLMPTLWNNTNPPLICQKCGGWKK